MGGTTRRSGSLGARPGVLRHSDCSPPTCDGGRLTAPPPSPRQESRDARMESWHSFAKGNGEKKKKKKKEKAVGGYRPPKLKTETRS